MTTEEVAKEVREVLDGVLNGEGRPRSIEGALLLLSRALSPESDDFVDVITDAFYTLSKAVVFRGGMSAGYAETVTMFKDLAESSIFLTFASMPALIEGMNKARANHGEPTVPPSAIIRETLRDFAEGVKSGRIPIPDTEPKIELFVMPDGLVSLHPRDNTSSLPKEHWMDMSGAVPLVVKS